MLSEMNFNDIELLMDTVADMQGLAYADRLAQLIEDITCNLKEPVKIFETLDEKLDEDELSLVAGGNKAPETK